MPRNREQQTITLSAEEVRLGSYVPWRQQAAMVVVGIALVLLAGWQVVVRQSFAVAPHPTLPATEVYFDTSAPAVVLPPETTAAGRALEVGDAIYPAGHKNMVMSESMQGLQQAIRRMNAALTKKQALEILRQGLAYEKLHGPGTSGLSAQQRRQLIEQAGLHEAPARPAGIKPVATAPRVEEEDTVAFTRSVARELVRDEVEDILHKINLLTEIGRFVGKKLED